MTEGIAVDMTLSVNYTWEKKLWDVMTYRLGVNEWIMFYSPLTEATVMVFKMRTHGKDHTIIKWSNSYYDPSPGMGVDAEVIAREAMLPGCYSRSLCTPPTKSSYR